MADYTCRDTHAYLEFLWVSGIYKFNASFTLNPGV